MASGRVPPHTDSIYIIRCGDSQKFKIGVSKHPEDRLKQLQTGCPDHLSLLFHTRIEPSISAYKAEATTHTYLREHDVHLSGEWFELSDDQVVELASVLLRSVSVEQAVVKKEEEETVDDLLSRLPEVPTHLPTAPVPVALHADQAKRRPLRPIHRC